MAFSSSDKDIVIVNTLRANLRQENRGIAKFIESLLELNAARGWARLGFSSLHDFCTRDLGLSDAEAATRIRVAYLSQSIPDLLPALAESRISLTGIRILAPILNSDNFSETVKTVQGLSTRDLETFRAKILPSAELPTRGSIRVVGVLSQNQSAIATKTESISTRECLPAKELLENKTSHLQTSHVQTPQSPLCKNEVASVAPEVRIALYLQENVWKKFQRVCDLSNRPCSGNQLSAVLETLVDDSIRHHDPLHKKTKTSKIRKRVLKKKSNSETYDKAIVESECFESFAETDQNATPSKTPKKTEDGRAQNKEISPEEKGTRYIPQKTRREVSERDEGRCSFVDSTTGRRCSCTRGLQYDHVIPFAKGGSSCDSANIRLLCRSHNLLAADAVFGSAFMQKKITARQPRSKAPLPGHTTS